MDSLLLFLLFAAAWLASALGGVLGMASGIFIVPMLTLLFGIDIRVAVGASLISVIACSCASAGPLLRTGLVNLRLAALLGVATALGALSGVFLIGVATESFLYGLFALILAISAWQMLSRRGSDRTGPPPAAQPDRLGLASSWPDEVTGAPVPYAVQRVPLGLGLMYGAGAISALLGIGSGVLKIPALDTAMRLPIKVSGATSNFMIAVTGAAGAAAYLVRGDIDLLLAAPVAIGSVLGARAGTRALIRLSPERLRLFFVIVLALLAVQMLWTAVSPGGAA